MMQLLSYETVERFIEQNHETISLSISRKRRVNLKFHVREVEIEAAIRSNDKKIENKEEEISIIASAARRRWTKFE